MDMMNQADAVRELKQRIEGKKDTAFYDWHGEYSLRYREGRWRMRNEWKKEEMVYEGVEVIEDDDDDFDSILVMEKDGVKKAHALGDLSEVWGMMKVEDVRDMVGHYNPEDLVSDSLKLNVGSTVVGVGVLGGLTIGGEVVKHDMMSIDDDGVSFMMKGEEVYRMDWYRVREEGE